MAERQFKLISRYGFQTAVRAIQLFTLSPHLKSHISSPTGNLDWVKQASLLPTPGSSWMPHIPSSVTPGTISMTATGKSFQTGLEGREWESLLQQSSLSPPWTRHSEKPVTRLKLIAHPGRDWGPGSTMQPENLSSCLVRVAEVQAHVTWWMECPVLLVCGSRSGMGRKHLALLPSRSTSTVQQMDFWPFHGWGEVEICTCYELKQHKENFAFTSQIRNTKPVVAKF